MQKKLADALGFTALAGKDAPEIAEGLSRIVGIGPRMAEFLNDAGIFEVYQLAELTDDALRALGDQVSARARRDDWLGQARKMAGRERGEHTRRPRRARQASSH